MRTYVSEGVAFACCLRVARSVRAKYSTIGEHAASYTAFDSYIARGHCMGAQMCTVLITARQASFVDTEPHCRLDQPKSATHELCNRRRYVDERPA